MVMVIRFVQICAMHWRNFEISLRETSDADIWTAAPCKLSSLNGEGVLVDLLQPDDVGLLEEDGGLVAVGRREGGLPPPLALHHLLAALLEVLRVVQVVHGAPPPPARAACQSRA